MAGLKEAMRQQGFITAAEAAKVAGMSIYSIYNWLNSGKIDGKRIARHWFVRVESLEAYVGEEAIKIIQTLADS